MKPNRVKRMLREGRTTCGSWVSLCSPIGAEVMGRLGFDWLLIDMEHGSGDYQTLVSQLQGVGCAGETEPVVRVEWNDPVTIKRVLDAGARGVMIPGVASVDEAQAAIAATRYPPQGNRGIAGVTRAAGFGLDPDYLAQINDEVLVFLQFETPAAVEQAEAILALEGIDVAFIGPSDLSAALGHRGEPQHPEVQEAIARVERAAHARGVPLGTVSRSWEQARERIDKGYRAMSLLGDVLFMIQAARQALEEYRRHPHVAGA